MIYYVMDLYVIAVICVKLQLNATELGEVSLMLEQLMRYISKFHSLNFRFKTSQHKSRSYRHNKDGTQDISFIFVITKEGSPISPIFSRINVIVHIDDFFKIHSLKLFWYPRLDLPRGIFPAYLLLNSERTLAFLNYNYVPSPS